MSDDASDARPKLSLFGLGALIAVLIGVALLLVGTGNKNAAPFTADQVHPTLVDLEVRHPDGPHLDSFLDGSIEVDGLPAPDATYAVIVVDNRRHRVVPIVQQRRTDKVGWNNAVASLREKFDWHPSDGDRSAFFAPGVRSFPFVARLPESAVPVTDLGSDLSVVLALTHGGDSVYWSVKLAYHG